MLLLVILVQAVFVELQQLPELEAPLALAVEAPLALAVVVVAVVVVAVVVAVVAVVVVVVAMGTNKVKNQPTNICLNTI